MRGDFFTALKNRRGSLHFSGGESVMWRRLRVKQRMSFACYKLSDVQFRVQLSST